jgi:N utilization substance protein B
MALKALYQMDVGKMPLSEALEDIFAQAHSMVDTPMMQSVHDAQTLLKQTAQERAGELSPVSLRQVKRAASAASVLLGKLAEEIASQTCALFGESQAPDVQQAEQMMRSALEETRASLLRLKERDTLQPEIIAELIALALKRADQMEHTFLRHLPASLHTASFAQTLVRGVLEKRQEIDDRLSALSTGWALDRQATVDRNIMRLAAYEILYLPDIPAGATINEAVEIAKKYSTAESGRFVNGILGSLVMQTAQV